MVDNWKTLPLISLMKAAIRSNPQKELPVHTIACFSTLCLLMAHLAIATYMLMYSIFNLSRYKFRLGA